MSDQTRLSGLSEELWRSVIAELKAAGWSVQIGGGLDFSWALMTREAMRIDMEYDNWVGGEMAFDAIHADAIRADLKHEVSAILFTGSQL